MIFFKTRGSGHILKTRHIHICIDDESYFALLSLQSKTGLSKTQVIENLLKKGDFDFEKRRIYENLCKNYEI